MRLIQYLDKALASQYKKIIKKMDKRKLLTTCAPIAPADRLHRHPGKYTGFAGEARFLGVWLLDI